MIVKSLTLKNFRNHDLASFQFNEGINLITGPNASGKTNVIEAINYLSLSKSFKGVDDQDLIQKGKNFAAEINATVLEGEIKRNLRIIITEKGKQVYLNGKPIKKLAELIKIINAVLFEPKDVMLFRGLPKERRNFIDVNLSKKSSSYFDYLSRYNKVLDQRNELLKSNLVDTDLLAVNTEMLIKLSGPIVNYRTMYLKDINDILNKIARTLTGAKEKVEVIYKPFVKFDDNFESNAKEAFNKALESDLKHKATSTGIHREDFSVNLNGEDIAEFGSQGQNRLIALALKLSPYFLIEDKDKRPIVILDDVMSELDQNHQGKLIKFLRKLNQVFITGTKLTINDSTHYEIKEKSITKEVF